MSFSGLARSWYPAVNLQELRELYRIFLWIEQVNMNTRPQKLIQKKCSLRGKHSEMISQWSRKLFYVFAITFRDAEQQRQEFHDIGAKLEFQCALKFTVRKMRLL